MAFVAADQTNTTEKLRQRLERLVSAMKNERTSFESHWRELSEYFAPRKARFTVTDRNRGEKRSQKIIDSTPIFAARTLAAGMMSGVTSPARPWFRLTVPDKQLAELHAVKMWLEAVRERMASVFIRSNLYNQLPSVYADMGVFGTAAMAVEEDDETTIRCMHFPIGEYWFATNAKGQVRTFAREFEWTVRQVVERFGRKDREGRLDDTNLSTAIVRAWREGHLDQTVTITHIITENDAFDPNRLDPASRRYLSCYYEAAREKVRGEEQVLEVSGYEEWPTMGPRWETSAGDVYATNCPGMTALSDNKALQFGEKMMAQAIEKTVKPPMIAPSSMRATAASILPGGITYVDEAQDKKFRPAIDVSGMRLDHLGVEQNKVRERVKEAFFVNLFLMISSLERGQITATEINARQEEKLLTLGPVLERINEDLLDPLVDRTFAIMLRRGEIPEPPPELEGVALRVEYVSVMAQAQRTVGRYGLETFLSMAASAAQISESVLDKIDLDQAIDVYGEMTGIPPSIIVADETVSSIREARAQQMQAAQQAQLATEEAAAAQTLSQTPVSGDNALARLLGSVAATPASEALY